MDVNIGCLPGKSTHRRLVDKNARIGQGQSFLVFSGSQQQGRHGGRLADADRGHVILYVLHGVVNRHTSGDRSARGIDVQLNVFRRLFLGEKQHLRDHQVGDVVVNRRAYEDDVVAQQPGIDVVGAFASSGLLDDHWYQHQSLLVNPYSATL